MRLLLIAIVFFGFCQECNSNNLFFEESFYFEQGSMKFWVSSPETLLDSNFKLRYSIKNLFDNDIKTAWVTRVNDDVDGGGVFRIVFDEPMFIEGVAIYNGYQKSDKVFNDNSRARIINFEKIIPGGISYAFDNDVALKDEMGKQFVSLESGWSDTINLFPIKELVVKIINTYPGKKYADLCLSQLCFISRDSPSYVPTISWSELRNLVDLNKSTNKNGWEWKGLLEDDYEKFNDLLYYVLDGENEANSYFEKYFPMDTGMSESMNNIYKPAVHSLFGVGPKAPVKAGKE